MEEKLKVLERRIALLEKKIQNQSVIIAKLERENTRRKSDVQTLASRMSK